MYQFYLLLFYKLVLFINQIKNVKNHYYQVNLSIFNLLPDFQTIDLYIKI